MNLTSKIALTFSILIIVFTMSVAPAAAQDQFSGTWTLNREISDTPADKIVRADVAGTVAETDSLKSVELARHPLLKPFPPNLETLKILYDAPEFRIEPQIKPQDQILKTPVGEKPAMPIGEDGKPIRLIAPFARARVFYTDGRIVKQELQPGKTIEIKAFREESKIVVTEDSPFGERSVESYELSPDGKQLFVVFQVENSKIREKPAPLRFVYDRVND